MGYRSNRLDELVFLEVPKPMLTEFDITFIIDWRVVYHTALVFIHVLKANPST